MKKTMGFSNGRQPKDVRSLLALIKEDGGSQKLPALTRSQ